MAKKPRPSPIEVVRVQAPFEVGSDTLHGRGMALVNAVLNPEDQDGAACALFQLLDLVHGIENKCARRVVAHYCMVQSALYLENHVEVMKEAGKILVGGRGKADRAGKPAAAVQGRRARAEAFREALEAALAPTLRRSSARHRQMTRHLVNLLCDAAARRGLRAARRTLVEIIAHLDGEQAREGGRDK